MAEPPAVGQAGWTGLMYACCNNHFELAEYLMKCDANTMLTDSRGRTASTMAKDTPMRRLLE